MAEIIWSDIAKEHLKEIDSYISTGAPVYSIIFIDKLIASVEKLERFPKLGRIVPEFEREDVLEVFFHKYRIVYLYKENVVTILAVVHGAMDITKKRNTEKWDLN